MEDRYSLPPDIAAALDRARLQVEALAQTADELQIVPTSDRPHRVATDPASGNDCHPESFVGHGPVNPMSSVMPWSRPAVYPPSTAMACPVTNDASRETRNAAVPAISSARPSLRSACSVTVF